MDEFGYGHLDLQVSISGPVDPELARGAVEELCRRHAILRSRYEKADPVRQLVLDDWRPSFRYTDLTGIPELEVSKALAEARLRAGRRFDLLHEVPFELELLRRGPREYALLGRMHHIAMDGWSFSLLLEDFERVYSALEKYGNATGVPPRPQYEYFAEAQRAHVNGTGIVESREYWRRRFSGSSGPTRLPGPDRPLRLDGIDPESGRCVNEILDTEFVGRVGQFAQSFPTTVFPVLVSAFALMLREVTGEVDLVFGTTAAGRHLPGTEEMIGVFVNPLPIRIELTDTPEPQGVVREVEERLLEFHRHQNYVLADLIQHVEPFVGTGINDTFHAYLLFQNFPRPEQGGPRSYSVLESDDISDRELASLRGPHGKLMRDLELIVIGLPDGSMSLNFWYRQGRFSSAQVSDWSRSYVAILRRLVGEVS
jgi:hypothetical protein